MEQPAIKTYPSIAQSFGMAGILIGIMLLFSPISFALNSVLDPEASSLVYYILAMGLSFCIAYKLRRNATGETSFDLTIGNKKILAPIVIATVALLFGIITPLGSLIPMPDLFKDIFRSMAGQRGVLAAANFSAFAARFFVDLETAFDETIYDLYGGGINLIVVIAGCAVLIWACTRLLNEEFGKEDVNGSNKSEKTSSY